MTLTFVRVSRKRLPAGSGGFPGGKRQSFAACFDASRGFTRRPSPAGGPWTPQGLEVARRARDADLRKGKAPASDQAIQEALLLDPRVLPFQGGPRRTTAS